MLYLMKQSFETVDSLHEFYVDASTACRQICYCKIILRKKKHGKISF